MDAALLVCHQFCSRIVLVRLYHRMPRDITLPVDTVERLMDLAARAAVSDVPTLSLFADVRLRIEQAKRK